MKVVLFLWDSLNPFFKFYSHFFYERSLLLDKLTFVHGFFIPSTELAIAHEIRFNELSDSQVLVMDVASYSVNPLFVSFYCWFPIRGCREVRKRDMEGWHDHIDSKSDYFKHDPLLDMPSIEIAIVILVGLSRSKVLLERMLAIHDDCDVTEGWQQNKDYDLVRI